MADFNVPENPELNLLLRMLQTTDRGHADVFNVLFGQLIQNDAFLDALAKKMIEKTMITHVLDSVNINSVLGADQGAVITALIDKERDRITKLNSDLKTNPLTLQYSSTNTEAIFEQVAEAVAMSTKSGLSIRRLQLNTDGTLHIYSSSDGGKTWTDRVI